MNDQIINPVQSVVIDETIQKPSSRAPKIVIALIVFLIIGAIAFFGISQILDQTNTKIDNVNNAIEKSLADIQPGDFAEDLDVEFIDEATMTGTAKEVNTSVKEIDDLLSDLNDQSDFSELEDINFNQ